MKNDKNEKIKLGCAVLCEGKYDKIKLSSVIDGVILTTDGFSVFNNSEKRALLRRLCESKGLVIITDSDKAGFFIRSKLKGMLPQDRVKHLYIPQIKGRERRKKHDSKDGLLGVEGIDAASLREIILRAKLDEAFDVSGYSAVEAVTKAQLYSLGLSGRDNSTDLREKLCEKLDLPKSLTSNALVSALQMLGISFEDVEKTVNEIKVKKKNVFFPEIGCEIMAALKSEGYECYFVGGCVRDYLMGCKAHDFDLTTNAPSDIIIEILKKNGFDAFLIGGDCGTVGAKKYGSDTFEITPYRAESEYRDHRHPDKVVFVKELKEDLARRDFTVNSMALTFEDDGRETVVDIFDGKGDLERKLIKCVNDPLDRFEEDALRILRAFRFASRFGFEIEEKTASAITEKSRLLSFISGERKQDELKKMLEKGGIETILAKFSAVFSEVVGSFEERGVDSVKGGFCEKLFFMLRKNEKCDIEETLSDLKLSKADREKILEYKEIFDSADIVPEELAAKHGYVFGEYLKAFGGAEKALAVFEDRSLPKELKELDIGGDDLLKLGISGRDIGKTLYSLLLAALKKDVTNKKEELISYAEKFTEDKI